MSDPGNEVGISSLVRIWKICHLSPRLMQFHMNFKSGVFSRKTLDMCLYLYFQLSNNVYTMYT